jgi:hypothetical protein
VAGGVLEILGLLAVLAGIAELLTRLTAPKKRRSTAVVDPLWPRLEPEVEELRRKALL